MGQKQPGETETPPFLSRDRERPDQLKLKNLAITGGLVHIAAVGAGAFSLDGYSLKDRRSPA